MLEFLASDLFLGLVIVIGLLLIAIITYRLLKPYTPKQQHYETELSHRPTISGMTHSGKCRKSRCRRKSRQHPVNGAWRRK